MNDVGYRPFAPALPPAPARALPWLTVIGGSLVTILPFVAPAPMLPPCGLLMLLAWRLRSRFAMRPWAAAPLGFVDDLVSGQPLGSGVLLWSLCFLAVDLLEQRLILRDFWQEWLLASGAVAFCLVAGRLLATPIGAQVDGALLAQIVASAMLLPPVTRLVAWIDARRNAA